MLECIVYSWTTFWFAVQKRCNDIPHRSGYSNLLGKYIGIISNFSALVFMYLYMALTSFV